MRSIILTFFLFMLPCQAEQVRLLIIDTGFPTVETGLKVCKDGIKDFTGTDVYDKIGHGTSIAHIIAEKLKNKDYCSYVFKVYAGKNDEHSIVPFLKSLLYFYKITDKIDVINYSSTGIGSLYLEEVLINGIIAKGTKFVAAAGNNSQNLDIKCDVFPACYKNVISVGNMGDNGKPTKHSNYGSIITAWRKGDNICFDNVCMSGSSMSVAFYTSDLALSLYTNKK